MSILIKGMEMPKNCSDCRLMADGWCYSVGLEQREKISTVKRPTWCPLVPVPPHGRLIDADELMKHKGECYDADGHLLYSVGTGNILRAPTIIPAEEGE